MELLIQVPSNFNFKRTAISHGWYDLPPFALDRENWTLTRVIDVGKSRPVVATIKSDDRGIVVSVGKTLSARVAEKIIRDVRHMLRLDDNLGDFYDSVAHDPEFNWIGLVGAGRLLRSPTVFEDLVKTICTTNCSWALTDKMVNSLVDALGRPATGGSRTFPSPEAMAEMPVSFYRDEVRSGYRAPYLKELAVHVASGDLDPEAWLRSELSTPELKKEMKKVKGVGDYAAENLLRLVGRYDVLALDSWVRGKFARIRNQARKTPDKKIERYYSRFGTWRGLALWCDMTRDWLEESETNSKW